jgi:hypothetical protein
MLLKSVSGIPQNTKDATAAGRLGTVDQNFDAVGDVLMANERKTAEPEKLQNFKGELSNVKIYNKLLK